jgi:hypothetical protein
MVHFPGFARARPWIHRAVRGFYPRGFPHSEIPGSTPACGSPRLIAACHVLHRLLLPRHPPCALSSLTTKFTQHTASLTSLAIPTDVVIPSEALRPPKCLSFRNVCHSKMSVIPSEARNLLSFRPAQSSATNTPLKSHGPSCLLIARNAYQCFAPQQAKIQALIKIYVRLVIAQSIQLSNIVLADFHQQTPPQQVWVLLPPDSCTIPKFLQPNVRRQPSLAPNVRLNPSPQNLLRRPRTIRIDAALDLRQPLLMLMHHSHNRNHPADDDRHYRHQQTPQVQNAVHNPIHSLLRFDERRQPMADS